MNKKKYLFGIIGFALGFLAMFYVTKRINESNAATSPAPTTAAAPGAPNSQSQQGMMTNVRDALEKAKNNPNDFQAQVEAARMYYQVNQLDEAIEYLKKAQQIDPKNLGVTATIGNLYFDQKKYDEAEKWFSEALKIKDDPELRVELASTYLQREPPNAERAIQELQLAVKADAKNPHAVAHLIEACLLKKDISAAEQNLNKLKELDASSQRIPIYTNLIADAKAGKAITIPKE